jgi:hypothetical protein
MVVHHVSLPVRWHAVGQAERYECGLSISWGGVALVVFVVLLMSWLCYCVCVVLLGLVRMRSHCAARPCCLCTVLMWALAVVWHIALSLLQRGT